MKAIGAIGLIATVLAGCTAQPEAVPRATAYPRPALPDTASAPYSIGAVNARLCAGVQIDAPRNGWLTATYPTLSASIHISVTDTTTAAIEQMKANRMQRLMLNVGDCPSRNREFVSAGGFAAIITTANASATPVQFLATDNERIVVSGAVFMPSTATASYDSIAPIIEFFEQEATRFLNTLCYE